MSVTATAAWWFLPFVLPICLYVAYTDLARMKITNRAVIALGAVFVSLGPFLLPLDLYLWRLVALAAVLAVGVALNAVGALGAGDAKFCAAAAPYVALGDLRLLLAIFTIVMLSAVIVHRTAKHSPLRRLAPHWISWGEKKKFPMGLALGPALSIYLLLGAIYGA